MQVSNALWRGGAIKARLIIPYLMGARFDRIMEPGDSFDLEVVANAINSCAWREVVLYDPHSHVSLDLIQDSVEVTNKTLVESYVLDNAVLIVPDKGAKAKASDYPVWNPRLVDVVQCDKERDLSNGRITLKVLEPEKCEGRNCVIIDDLCDGGGTFLAIASQINPAHLTLMVTHGIFSKDFRELEEKFQSIITTDSYYPWGPYNSKTLTVIPIENLK
jgi:ribose-phosphate pyrophosphokinase